MQPMAQAPARATLVPAGVVLGQSMPQGMVSGQGPFDVSAMQAAVMQIGQAAQAHAAEAARLQVLAANFGQDGSQQMPAGAPQLFVQGCPGYAVPVLQQGMPAAMACGGISYSQPPGQALPGSACKGSAAALRAAAGTPARP